MLMAEDIKYTMTKLNQTWYVYQYVSYFKNLVPYSISKSNCCGIHNGWRIFV